MTWLLWRQHRVQGAVAAGLLGALGILLWITGVAMSREYHTATSSCRSSQAGCDGLNLFQGDGLVVTLVNLTLTVPVLIGVFWGATSVAREYDNGTNVLAWTQSVTRRRWLRDKVAVLLGSSLVAGAALSGMVTWWSQTLNDYHHDRFQPLEFELQGLTPIGYTLFAAALGLATGVLWRRVVPAIATTIAGYIGVRLAVQQWARPHFGAPITVIDTGGPPTGAWQLHSDMRHDGVIVNGPIRVPGDCVSAPTRDVMTKCLAHHGYQVTDTYHPASQYWTFQWIEAGIFAASAATLVVLAVVVVRRRDA